MLKLLQSWALGKDEFLKKFEVVLFLQCRDHYHLERETALGLFALHLYDIGDKKEVERYLERNSEKLLVVLDGADEGGEAWERSKGLKDLLARRALSKCSLVMTSRPCERAYAELVPVCDQHFHLAGLSDGRLEELFRKGMKEQRCKEMLEELGKPRWWYLRRQMKETPLIANMVVNVANDGLPFPETRTELYRVIVVNLVKRDHYKLKRFLEITCRLEDLPEDVEQSLRKLGELSLEGLKKRRYVFDMEKDVEAVFGKVESFGLLEETRQWTPPLATGASRARQVQFSHLTILEFLAAYYVSQAENLESELDRCREKVGIGEETSVFWRFVAGLVDVKRLKTVMVGVTGGAAEEEQWSKKKHLLLGMSCFAEAALHPCKKQEEKEQQKEDLQAASAVFVPSRLDLSSYPLSVEETHSLSVTLAHAGDTKMLDVYGCGLTNEHANVLEACGGLQHVVDLNLGNNAGLHGNGMACVARALEHNGKLEVMRLRVSFLEGEDFQAVHDIITTNKSLRWLDLFANRISPCSLAVLRPALSQSHLKILNLRCTGLERESGGVVGEVLSTNQHWKAVDLGENQLGNEGAAYVLTGAEGAMKLALLELSENKLDDGVVDVLGSVLLHRSLQPAERSDQIRRFVGMTVCLHGNNISKESLVQIADQVSADSSDCVECDMYVVRKGKVQQRDLSVHLEQYAEHRGQGDLVMVEMGLGDEGAALVASLISGDCNQVEALNMPGNGIGDEGAVAVASGLVTNSTLRGLSLAKNNVGSVGFIAMATSLVEKNCTLQFLDLSGNPIFMGGGGGRHGNCTKKAAELLSRSRSLQFVGLAVTGIGDEECEVIGDALAEDMCGVVFLHLAYNQITSKGASALCRGLEKNSSILYVDLSHNEIDSDGTAVIQQCIEAREEKGQALEYVWMEENQVDAAKLSGTMLNSMFAYPSISDVIEMYLK